MRTTDQNRGNMLTATAPVLAKHQTTWQYPIAFSEGVYDLTESLTLIDEPSQMAGESSGTASVRDAVRQALGQAVSELIGAMRAYAARTVNPEIAAKVAYSPKEVISGKAVEIVARCRAIHTAATDIAADLVAYGISPTKFTNVKRKIDAFDALRIAPQPAPAPAPVAV